MSLKAAAGDSLRFSFPRSRGDEPPRSVQQLLAWLFSPLTRG